MRGLANCFTVKLVGDSYLQHRLVVDLASQNDINQHKDVSGTLRGLCDYMGMPVHTEKMVGPVGKSHLKQGT